MYAVNLQSSLKLCIFVCSCCMVFFLLLVAVGGNAGVEVLRPLPWAHGLPLMLSDLDGLLLCSASMLREGTSFVPFA